MPLQVVSVRRGVLGLTLAFVAALASVLTVLVVWLARPAPQFAPLTLSHDFYLTNGSAGAPPQLLIGRPFQFNQLIWCNAADHPLNAVLSASFVSLNLSPMLSVPVASAVPVPVASGCGARQGAPFSAPQPLAPGQWRLNLAITVTDHGQSQVVSLQSQPFTIVLARDGGE